MWLWGSPLNFWHYLLSCQMQKPPHTFLHWSLKYHHLLKVHNPPPPRQHSGVLWTHWNLLEHSALTALVVLTVWLKVGKVFYQSLYPSSQFPLANCYTGEVGMIEGQLEIGSLTRIDFISHKQKVCKRVKKYMCACMCTCVVWWDEMEWDAKFREACFLTEPHSNRLLT